MLACAIMLPRRCFQHFLAASLILAICLIPGGAQASIARALGLPELVRASQHVVVGVPVQGFSRWETQGKQRRIVTYTRVRVEETLAGVASGHELLIRTLGGQVGDIGQIVHGEAVLRAGERSVLFVTGASDGTLVVTAMAQGHFPLKVDAGGALRLRISPQLAELVGAKDSAVRRLNGKLLLEAQRLLEEAARQ